MNLKNVLIASLLAVLSIGSAFAQGNTLTGTTASAAISLEANQISVASATGLVAASATVAGSLLYVESPGSKGEAMRVQSINGTLITVARGVAGTRRVAHTSGAMILHGPANYFYTTDPQGACTAARTVVTPYVNIANGNQWLCSTITLSWVPGWGNTSRPALPTAAVASVAGATTVSGPLFHITGTNAITGFTLPLGFNGGRFCAIADAIWTWTAAGNIAVLGTTTAANRHHCFVWDPATVKWYPDKVI
jgi:hypothetical protein